MPHAILEGVKRMTEDELDAVALRLEEIRAEEDRLQSKLQVQVDEFGFTLLAPRGRSA